MHFSGMGRSCKFLIYSPEGKVKVSPVNSVIVCTGAVLKTSCLQADNFMEAVFIAVYVDLELLQKIVSDQVGGSPEMTHHHCQQCEASLQCIYTLCRQKPLEDYLVKHKVCFLLSCVPRSCLACHYLYYFLFLSCKLDIRLKVPFAGYIN